jgi:hypothetical protein
MIMTVQYIDLGVVMIANLFNLLVTGIMISRPLKKKRAEFVLGVASVILALPLLGAVGWNWMSGREWWAIVLPGLLMIFCLVELLLDYVFKYPFRQTRWLGPYLLLFYLAQWGGVGYSFLVAPAYGVITLLTYFLSLGATAYSYKRVGHGI